MEKFQKICATGFLFHNDKVLLLKRSEKEAFLPNYYELVGGKIDFGETVEEGLIREFKEETNLEINVLQPYSTFAYVSNEGNRHTVDIQLIVELKGAESDLKLSPAHAEHIWITETELDNYQVTDEMKKAIKKGFKEIKL